MMIIDFIYYANLVTALRKHFYVSTTSFMLLVMVKWYNVTMLHVDRELSWVLLLCPPPSQPVSALPLVDGERTKLQG